MQYAVLLSGEPSIIDNIQSYFAQQYVEKILTELSLKDALSGELYAKDFIELKIIYRLDTGMVTLEGSHAPSVKSFFTSNAFYEYTQPVLQAIRWLSKFCLLHHVYMQGDAEINQLFAQSKYLDASTGKLNHQITEKQLDYLLVSILHLVSPKPPVIKKMVSFVRPVSTPNNKRTDIQKAMYRGFLELDINKENVIDKISSINHVNQWLETIGSHLSKIEGRGIKP